MAEKFKIIQSEHLSEIPAAWLVERAELIVCAYDDPQFDKCLEDAVGLIVRTYTQVNSDLLDKAPKLRVVGRAGVALENIDILECRKRGIEVVHAPGSNAQAVVEYVMCLLCDALRPRVTFDKPVEIDDWERVRAEVFAKTQICEKSVGILGLGHIGKRVAEVMCALGCEVYFNDIVDIPEDQWFGAVSVSTEELFESCDILTVHIDSRPGNHHFVNANLIDRMKSDALLINTSRGLAIDHGALASFLKKNKKARAMIDVHDPEPPPAAYPLFGLPNVALLPHLAGRTETALTNMSWVVKDVLAVLEGSQPTNPAP